LTSGINGADGLGGGGGGGGADASLRVNANGGSGGDGIIYIRFPKTSATVTL
jgi:hypothetical protein